MVILHRTYKLLLVIVCFFIISVVGLNACAEPDINTDGTVLDIIDGLQNPKYFNKSAIEEIFNITLYRKRVDNPYFRIYTGGPTRYFKNIELRERVAGSGETAGMLIMELSEPFPLREIFKYGDNPKITVRPPNAPPDMPNYATYRNNQRRLSFGWRSIGGESTGVEKIVIDVKNRSPAGIIYLSLSLLAIIISVILLRRRYMRRRALEPLSDKTVASNGGDGMKPGKGMGASLLFAKILQ